MRIAWIERLLSAGLLTGVTALVAISISACGSESASTSEAEAESGSATVNRGVGTDKAVSEYEEVLRDLSDAAAAGEVYDAYGFAEYMPASQRAAIDAFCFVTERLLDDGEVERFDEPAYVAREVRAKAGIEFDYGDEAEIGRNEMTTVRRAIRKLRSIIEYETIDRELAGNYVTACYNRSG